MSECKDFDSCDKCDKQSTCKLKNLKIWLEEHHTEADTMLEDSISEVSEIVSSMAKNPFLLLCSENVNQMMRFVALYYYWKGRTYQQVPEVFREVSNDSV